ncbi:MAG: hypothetical protein U9O59_03125 [Actinomycetota bacterium]|nr:hypothetical protein [Actinomycetota bacterium]
MKIIKSKIKILAVSAASILLILISISCTPGATEKIDVDQNGTQEDTLSEDEIKELEEAVEAVDYENAEIGAEIKGYIPSFLCTDSDNYIKIEITNNSDFTWRSDGQNIVRIGYHYYGQDVEYSDYDKTARITLPDNLEPGESVTLDVMINDIVNEGTYVIQIDPVVEGKFWFSSKDVEVLQGKVFFGSCK